MSLDTLSFEEVWGEFWISLASLLRSYTELHGLSSRCHATIDEDNEHISVHQGNNRLDLMRQGATVNWKREDGRVGVFEFTEAGQLRGPSGEEEMDMAAEKWARELMQ